MKRRLRLGALFVVSVGAGWIAFRLVPPPLPELSRPEFLAEVEAGHVHKIVIEDQEVIIGESATRGRFQTKFKRRDDDALVSELRGLGVDVEFTESGLGL